jgi:predicted RNase H-like HicB family nuclease
MKNYVAIAEPSEDGTWWISFPGFPGVTSAASGPGQIVSQAQDALASALGAGAPLPPGLEDGVFPLYDLGDYHDPLVVLIPFAVPAAAAAQ